MGFRDGERAQSTLVGAILLFAILIIAFSSYQAFVVPNQNAEVEFNHNSEVQTDMQDLRNSLLDVRSVEDGEVVSEHRPVRVRLGTQYPARLIALNPPTPAGTLETEAAGSEFRIENANVDGNFDGQPADTLLGPNPDADLGTTFLSYSPGYSEYREAPQTTLEHSLLYNEFPSADITVREQTLIRPESNRLNIVLFDGDISQSSSQGVTLDPETLDGPTATVPIEPVDDEDITLQIPTQNPEIWEDTLSELPDVSVDSSNENSVTVSLTDGGYTLRVTRVGFDGGAGDSEFTSIQPDSSGEDDGTADINPGNVRLNGIRTLNQGQNEIEIEFQNTNQDDISITEARINFYQSSGGQTPRNAVISADQDGDSGTLDVSGGFEPLDPEIILGGDADSTLWLDFDRGVQSSDWFIITLQFDNGGSGQYFVSLRDRAD